MGAIQVTRVLIWVDLEVEADPDQVQAIMVAEAVTREVQVGEAQMVQAAATMQIPEA
jgi:hypothetical protein